MPLSPDMATLDADPSATEVDERADAGVSAPVRVASGGLLAVLAAALSACGGGGGVGGGATVPAPAAQAGATPVTVPITQTQAARFLLQTQFSATDADIAAVIAQGYAGWLSGQYAMAVAQTSTAWLDQTGYRAIDGNLNFITTVPVENLIWYRAITTPDQMRWRLMLALSEVMVIGLDGIAGEGWPSYLAAGYLDVLSANVFGNYRTLLRDITLNPAMGMYLNTRGNLKENAAGRQPDENYAREVMQLFTLGLHELNEDGTPVKDLAGNAIETYTQADISNLARVFTGWDIDTGNLASGFYTFGNTTYRVTDPAYTSMPMANKAANHSTLEVNFLGTRIAANTDANTALDKALDTLFNHKNAGPFFARQMIQKLVTSNPSPAYIKRVAQAFANNGSGVRGDMKAVWTAILTDAEAIAVPDSATAGKLREPMIRLMQMARTFNFKSVSGSWDAKVIAINARNLGQGPMRASSVFNFFRPGYVPPNSAIGTAGLYAPEFQIVNESTVALYLNAVSGLLVSATADLRPDFTALEPLASNTQGLIDWLNLHLCAGQMSAATQGVIKTALDAEGVTASSGTSQKQNLIRLAAFLVMACAEYLVQK